MRLREEEMNREVRGSLQGLLATLTRRLLHHSTFDKFVYFFLSPFPANYYGYQGYQENS